MRWIVTIAVLHLLQGAAPARRRRIDPGCSINVNADLPKNAPVMLIVGAGSSHLALPVDNNGTLQLARGEQMVLACPGRSNKLESVRGSPTTVEATCDGGVKNLQVNRSSYSVKDLGCSNKASGEIRNTGRTCGPRHAKMLELGYLVGEQWYPLVDVCHIRNRSISLFAKHVLRGKLMKGAEKQSARPGFQVGGDFYPGFSPETTYKKSVQKSTLAKLLNSTKLAQEYIDKNFLARGHLAPDADFVLNAYQYLTYFYVNTAPQWQCVNAGNWLSLEKTLRKFAIDRTIDLSVITGTYDLLKLDNEAGKPREVFLYLNTTQTNQLPVPKYIWKIAYNEATKEGIAFVLLNNPFIEQVTLNEILCTNICAESGWLPKSKIWRKLSNGYLYCCEVSSLRNVITYIPKLDVKGILQGPN